MDEDFKEYLEEKGLRQVQIFNTAVSAVLGILCMLIVVVNYNFVYWCCCFWICAAIVVAR